MVSRLDKSKNIPKDNFISIDNEKNLNYPKLAKIDEIKSNLSTYKDKLKDFIRNFKK